MKKVWKRALAMLLVVLMIGGATPIGVLADMNWTMKMLRGGITV